MTEPEITKAEREELRALHAKTTQGKWVTHYGERGLFSGLLWVANRGSGVIQREDLEWIARTHNALPRLLRALDAAEARLAALVSFNEKLLGRERKEVYPDCDFCRDSGHGHECPGPIQNPRWAEIHDAIAAAKEPQP